MYCVFCRCHVGLVICLGWCTWQFYDHSGEINLVAFQLIYCEAHMQAIFGRWHIYTQRLTICDIVAHGITICDIVTNSMTICDVVTHDMTICDVVAHGVTICDIVTHDMTICDVVAHGMTICDIVTHRD